MLDARAAADAVSDHAQLLKALVGSVIGTLRQMEPRQAFVWKDVARRFKLGGVIERADMEMHFR